MSGVEARDIVEAAVRRELFGPVPGEVPHGRPVDCSTLSLTFQTEKEMEGPFHDENTLQEILTRSEPRQRYGIGVLHSGGQRHSGSVEAEEDFDVIPGLSQDEGEPGELFAGHEDMARDRDADVGSLRHERVDSDDFDLSDANKRKPSAMAISFKVRVCQNASLNVEVRGSYYEAITVRALGTPEKNWWLRRPFTLEGKASEQALRTERQRTTLPTNAVVGEGQLPPRVQPTVSIFSRSVPGDPDPNLRLITLSVINDLDSRGPGSTFFQVDFSAIAADGLRIEPYPAVDYQNGDEEDESIALLYRHRLTYAIGHGCAADWGEPEGGDLSVPSVKADALPAYEVASLTPDVYEKLADGTRTAVSVSMEELSKSSALGAAQVDKVLDLYAKWIGDRRVSIDDLPEQYRNASRRHMDKCDEALERMREGWFLIQNQPRAARAFALANYAMLHQQLRSRLPKRELLRESDGRYRPNGEHPSVAPTGEMGRWRAFQIAFILATLPELVDPSHPKRSVVDLIFFPTGGGKTEAYLGASAISLIARRLRNPEDTGTDTIMRYTLRLLTAQQFLRAASLICVLEDVRSKNEGELGSSSFSIGVWLGGDSTPNTWEQAKRALSELGSSDFAPNKFLLLNCPWCGTQMGPFKTGKKRETPGYQIVQKKKVIFQCQDELCRFGGRRGLPIHVVDEGIYSERPSIVIGTVDKFATMAWHSSARTLFGLGEDGERKFSPPNLIIQDELHLISGPLGSMVGLYEPVIEDLTTDHRFEPPIRPKIIASTATVRRYEEQIQALFGRSEVALFPPHGLNEGQSFFSEPATLDDGRPVPGRKYLGVLGASFGSTQTVQTRVTAATLQAGQQIHDPEDRDWYWTNLNFLNSLRELGNTLSLLDSDVPDYLMAIKRRDHIEPRYPRNRMELTSRRRSDEIPKAIEDLQVRSSNPQCVDVCLASNIIEVGIDIDRLALMTIVGQPKTTSQYIQVSGRVGRNVKAPGLVITIYGAMKPRDRSHYERFRTYHQQLYAQVEPTSVTPFAEPVLKRALHAAAISRIRQLNPELKPYPFPEQEFAEAVDLLRRRAEVVDSHELEIFDRWFGERANQWNIGERTEWSATKFFEGDPVQGLLRPAGETAARESTVLTWETPMSMRTVDAECRLVVSQAYIAENGQTEETDR